MNLLRTFLLALAIIASTPAFAATVPYEVDPRHTQVLFTYSHFGLSNITGRFGDVTGTIDFDAANPAASSVNVSIPVSSVSMGVPKLDTHLQSPDFFDAATFPTATFKSTKVTVAGEGKWQVAGDLTLHGVTKPVVLDVAVNFVGPHPMNKAPMAGFDATTTIKRSEFGVDGMIPGVPDEVRIRITLEAKGPKA
ncbi:MAG: YceI family protein [Arenimonas sp.]